VERGLITSVKKLFLVNYAPPTSSIYKYTGEILSCTEDYSEQLNLLYSNRSKRWELPTRGKSFKSPIKRVLYANILLSRLLFRKARKYILASSGEERVIHYTHQTISPFNLDLERSVVTIHDNPYTALKYGIYNKPNNRITDKMRFRLYSSSIHYTLSQYKKFKHVITTSDYVKNSLIKYGFRNEITTIHPQVGPHFHPIKDKEKLREELGLPKGRKLLLSVASDQPRKNLNMVERLMNELDQSYHLVRVGKPILDSSSFSNVDPQTINKIYNACDVLIMPSLEEGYGYPVPEAMTVGLPVVCSDIEVFHELCGDSGIYFNPLSVEDFRDAVKISIENYNVYSNKVIERSAIFSYTRFCMEINNYYKQRF